MLKMKPHCEKCQTATAMTSTAYICSYECTFCGPCTEGMNHVCPNCQGNLVLRPIRSKNPVQVVAAQVKKKFFKS